MTTTGIDVEVATETTSGNKVKLTRHIVELDAKGDPTDACLCGHLWDRLHVQHNGEICQECVDEMRRRGRAR